MRKFQHFVLLGLMMTLAACSKDETTAPDTGATAQTITVTVPQNGVPTRAVADNFSEGTCVNRCILEIYRGGALYQKIEEDVTTGKATFNLQLVSSQTYDFVFWADCADGNKTSGFTDKTYVTENGLQNITESAAFVGNSDERDAFCYHMQKKVDGAFTEPVTLTRPFGLLVVKTLDLGAIQDASLKPDQYTVSFKGLPNAFNALTGEVSGSADVTYTAVPAKTDGTISMDFLWATDDKADLADFSMTFLNNGAEITTNDAFKNIPIRRNYRTTVTGNLLTKKGTFEVKIDPIFEEDTDGEYDKEIVEVETTDDVTAAIANGATNVVVKNAPTAAATIAIPQTFTTTDAAVAIQLPATTVPVTVAYTAEQAANAPAAVNISAPSTSNLVINLPQSTVTLNGEQYTNVTVEAVSENTLIIPEGTEVWNLSVNKGNVEVYGTLRYAPTFGENAGVIKVYHVGTSTALANAVPIAVAGKCEKIVLTADVAIARPSNATLNVAGQLDLNGHKLIMNLANGATVPAGKSWTVTNGVIEASRAKVTQAAVYVEKDASLSLDGVQFKAKTTTDKCIALYPSGDASSISVKNSQIDGLYAITTNASITYTANIILENSTFTGNTPILLNVPVVLTMNNCTSKGLFHGVVMRGGTATISDSDISIEYNAADYDTYVHYFDNIDWMSGNAVKNAALTLGNKHATAYQYPTNVTLKNTKLHRTGTYGSYFPALYAWANQGDGLGVTLTYDEQCTFDGAVEYGSENITVNGQAVTAPASYDALSAALKAGGLIVAKENLEVNTTTLNATATLYLASGRTVSAAAGQPEAFYASKGCNLTIDGSGTLTGPTKADGNTAAVKVYQGGKVIIKGNVTIDGGSGSATNNAIFVKKGDVEIYNGYFHVGADKNGAPNSCILLYADKYALTHPASVTIYGGVFDDESGMPINIQGANGKWNTVTIYGGVFVGYDPATGDSGANVPTFVAEGYKSVKTTWNGKEAWEVVKQ